MLYTIIAVLYMLMGLASMVSIPTGFIYSVIFAILLLRADDKLTTQKKHLPLISFIYLPVFIVIVISFGIYLQKGKFITSWEMIILMPLMINTLLLFGWIFRRKILSAKYYSLWTIVILIITGFNIGVMLIDTFFGTLP